MSQLGLFDAPPPLARPMRVGDEWHSPSGRAWHVTAIDGAQVTMQHTHDGFTRSMTHTVAEWRRQGWRTEGER